MKTTQIQDRHESRATAYPPSVDARALLLNEVDFKWLMGGQGWWVNTHRFRDDPSYAAGLLRSALASPCDALRECATALKAQLDGTAP